MPDAQNVNPFDTTAEENELNALNAELEQARASLEGDFAKYAAENTSAELEELFFENKEEFFKAILEMQNTFLSKGYALGTHLIINVVKEKLKALIKL